MGDIVILGVIGVKVTSFSGKHDDPDASLPKGITMHPVPKNFLSYQVTESLI
jgi:hypothetical protein